MDTRFGHLAPYESENTNAPHSDNRMQGGVAAEYAVASELCRRGMYAQLTLGHQKRTDLLVFFESGPPTRVEVKAKQGPDWLNCKGICGPNVFIVFVDYQRRAPNERPDFFILSAGDWRQVLEHRVADIRSRRPLKRITITAENASVFEDEIGANGKPYRGMNVRAADVTEFRERWDKIAAAVGAAEP